MRPWFAVPLAATAFCAAAIANGGPVAFPDSAAYLLDAEMLAGLHAPHAVRPVLYGLGAELLSVGERCFALVLFAQALVLAHLLWLVAARIGTQTGQFLWLAVGLAVLTPISWHVSHLLPDIFIPVLVLALCLLGYCPLSRGERTYLTLLATAAAAMHMSALPIGMTVVATGALLRMITHRRVALLSMAAPVGLAIAGLLSFSMLIWHQPTLSPNSPPFLLARMLADGPAKEYLRATCPESGYTLCHYLDRLPATEEGLLWEMLPGLPEADGKQIKAEAGGVIRGTISMFPAQVAHEAATQTVRQLMTFGADTQLTPDQWTALKQDPSPLGRALSLTREARGEIWPWLLPWLNGIYTPVAGFALVAALAAWRRSIAQGMFLPAALISTVFATLLVNAFICGALSGVFPRYQGRIVWLLPFIAAAAWAAVERERSRVPTHVAARA